VPSVTAIFIIWKVNGAGIVKAVGAGATQVTPGDPVVVSLIHSCGKCFYCAQGVPFLCETVFPLDKESRYPNPGRNTPAQGMKTGAFAESVVVQMKDSRMGQ